MQDADHKVTVSIINDGIHFEAQKGQKLVDLCHGRVTSLLFGCCNATCGSCLISVQAGKDNLSKMDGREKKLLYTMFAEPADRLACQCEVLGDVAFEVPN